MELDCISFYPLDCRCGVSPVDRSRHDTPVKPQGVLLHSTVTTVSPVTTDSPRNRAVDDAEEKGDLERPSKTIALSSSSTSTFDAAVDGNRPSAVYQDFCSHGSAYAKDTDSLVNDLVAHVLLQHPVPENKTGSPRVESQDTLFTPHFIQATPRERPSQRANRLFRQTRPFPHCRSPSPPEDRGCDTA